ncbi:unnamed protein product [Brachionus calyciflorus]|uniref:Uncharacterized protein n=1 Tax=Brachionus calyciflorus TaxID=104777 RepID=A0A813QTG0_9BILA|nr:unnamed protein product [Brachionus calyciflorus]
MQDSMASMDTSSHFYSDSRASSTPSQPNSLSGLMSIANRNLDENTKSEITSFYLSNLNQLARIPYSFTIKPNSSVKTLSKDIYNITHLSVKSDPLTENDLFPVFKKITQSPQLLDENDLEDIFTSIQEVHLDVQHTKSQINSLIDLVKFQSTRIKSLQTENITLKSIIQNKNSILKQIQTSLNSKNVTNVCPTPFTNTNTPQIPIQNTPGSYSQAVSSQPAKNTGNKRPAHDSPLNPSKNKSQKRDNKGKQNSNCTQTSEYPNRQTTQPNGQSNLLAFDSTDPTQNSKPIIENEFKIAGLKRRMKKTSIQNYINSSGKSHNSGFKSCERKIEIYLGRISNEETFENVKSAVNSIVPIFNFEELQLVHKSFKSFKFSISVFDMEIIRE